MNCIKKLFHPVIECKASFDAGRAQREDPRAYDLNVTEAVWTDIELFLMK
jgi:hypothetical protein